MPQKQPNASERECTDDSPLSFLLPRLPQRLMIEMMRHSASSPPFCEALYQVFLRQQYRRLEGIQPFLSLLKAAKASLRHAWLPEGTSHVSAFLPHDTTAAMHSKWVDVFSLLLLSMDGYYYSLTGKWMLPTLFSALKDVPKTKGGEWNSRGAQKWMVQLSGRLQWYMEEITTPQSHSATTSSSSRCTLGSARGCLPLFAGVTSLSPSGQRAMWKAFANVCRTIFSTGKSGTGSSIRTPAKERGTKNSSGLSSHTKGSEDTVSFLEDRGEKRQEAPKSTMSDEELLFGMVLIPKIVSYFRQDGWVSDVEELMVMVCVPHTEKQ